MRLAVLEEHAEWTHHARPDSLVRPAFPVDRRAPWQSILAQYLAGWAEADPLKIIAASAPGYRLDDPLVGLFSRWSVPQYFDELQGRLSGTGALAPRDLAFVLHGPMEQSSSRLGLQFWREAPRLGLTGVATIKVGERGVIAETIAYDLNLASDLLRRGA